MLTCSVLQLGYHYAPEEKREELRRLEEERRRLEEEERRRQGRRLKIRGRIKKVKKKFWL